MGEDGRGLGEEEDPRVRQQQNPLASSAVSRCFSRSFSLFLSFSIPLPLLLLSVVLCSFRGLRLSRRTAVIPAFTSIRLTAPFVYMRARAFSR